MKPAKIFLTGESHARARAEGHTFVVLIDGKPRKIVRVHGSLELEAILEEEY